MADNLLKQAISSLASSLQAAGGVEVVYIWGEFPITLKATKGETEFEVITSSGLATHYRSTDWIIKASDLVVGGEEVEPQRGDIIEDGDDIYEVMPTNDLQPYRRADTYGILLRVHSLLKRIDNEQSY